MERKIMIVDDEKEIRRATQEVLEKEGYSVKTAKTTEAAWKKLQQWKAELILLDIMLPGDLEEFVKKVDQLGTVKVLYLSVVQEAEAERRGLLDLSDTILGYIEKPFSLATLLSKVKNALERER
ncbi:MAG: response regulator [Candidatus Korarchaeota archaeon]|nr:response regulator [Candidatus Korarchaeota archaeon]NIU83953.1 response regulator [Candidatus Thorarchaeota archaeon]NIW14081.1 response regulator [Candidatus Thorarchaeota archaeon]NIW52191.1 response regulator [Candidatus Korarchaeota archaeon]